MKNVTVTLEPKVARWARVEAAKNDMSLSRYLGNLLERQMERDAAYGRARRDWCDRPAKPLRREPTPYPGRDELHER